MVRTETKYYVGCLCGAHLEDGKVNITLGGLQYDPGFDLTAPLADLGELIDALRGQAPPSAAFDDAEFGRLLRQYRHAQDGEVLAAVKDLRAFFARAIAATRG